MPRLQDSVILIAGAGHALAYALVERCLAEGARVTVLEGEASRAVQLQGDFGAELLVVNDDPNTLSGHRQALALTLARHARLDGLVANGVCWDAGLSLAEIPDDDRLQAGFDAIIKTNVWRYVCGARVMSAALRRQRGSMVFTLIGAGGALAAAVRQAGVGLVRQLARELAPAVRVNGVCALLPPRELHSPFAAFASARAEGQKLDVCVPRYAPDPAREVEHCLALLQPHGSTDITGTVVECDDDPGIEGLITLA